MGDRDEYPTTGNGQMVPWRPSQRPRLTHSDLLHILDGDARGGGHRYGAGMGKSEFPESWDDERVAQVIDETLARPMRVAYDAERFSFLRIVEDQLMVVVVDVADGECQIVTAHPVEIGRLLR